MLLGERTLPHSLEAERAVLGAILVNEEHLALVLDKVRPGDFFRDAHRWVFEALERLSDRGVAIDPITVRTELARTGQLDEVGGPFYLAALMDGVPRSANAGHYADIVRTKARLRDAIYASNKMLSDAYDASLEPDAIIGDATEALLGLSQESAGGAVLVRDLLPAAMTALESAHANRQMVVGLPTGFTDLDEQTLGLHAGDQVVVGARPGIGKSALAMNIADHVSRPSSGRTSLVFSLEMTRDQLVHRLISAHARVDGHRLRTGHCSDADFARLSQAISQLSEQRLYIDDTPNVGLAEVRARCARVKAQAGLDLVVIDYIQLMRGSGKYDGRVQEVGEVSRGCKRLAKQFGVPFLVLSQLRRLAAGERSREPRLDDLRESGDLEQDADVVLLLHRTPGDESEGFDAAAAKCLVAKQRNGPTGSFGLTYLRQFTQFENAVRETSNG